jgi:hypothetical protein
MRRIVPIFMLMTRSDGHTLEDYIRLKAVLAEVFLEKLAESLMLKRRQLTLNQNLGDGSPCFQGVDPQRNVRSKNIVNSIHRVFVSVKPIAVTRTPAIMKATPSITMNHPNAIPSGVKKPNGADSRNNVLPYNTKTRLTTALSVFIPASSSSHP